MLGTMIGRWAENGEVPNDMGLLGSMVQNICYHNARNYFRLPGEGA